MLDNGMKDVNDYGKSADIQNKMWRGISQGIVSWPGNAIGCTPAQMLAVDKNKSPLDPSMDKYAKIGWRPEGHKRLGHLFHTILFMRELDGRWIYTSVKDRERKLVVNGKMDEFVSSY